MSRKKEDELIHYDHNGQPTQRWLRAMREMEAENAEKNEAAARFANQHMATVIAQRFPPEMTLFAAAQAAAEHGMYLTVRMVRGKFCVVARFVEPDEGGL